MTDGYRDHPIPPPKNARHIRGRRHGDLCCACPYEAQCREAVMRGSPIACERKIGRDESRNQLVVLSLGWGVQSWALAAMSALGVLPPVHAAIHADTGHERHETYQFARRWTPWLEEHGVPVVTVRGGRPILGLEQNDSYTSIPAHTTWADGRPSGMLRRQCTGDWKITPMRRWCAAELKRRGLAKAPGVVEKWLGITLDEIDRTKASSGVKYVSLAYPFITMLDRPWRRGDVIRWLTDNGLEVPVKSSCVFCPYHDRATWREIQRSGNGDWEKALCVDRAIRDKRPDHLCYLTAERKPLDECDFRGPEDHGQLALWQDKR